MKNEKWQNKKLRLSIKSYRGMREREIEREKEREKNREREREREEERERERDIE